MVAKHTLAFLYRRRDALMSKLATVEPFVHGSLVWIPRRCGNPGCHCAGGEKHRSLYLTFKAASGEGAQRRMKTQTIYVPLALQKDARAWVAEYKRMKELMRAISDVQHSILRAYIGQRGRGRD